jgi:hypothetical protein
VCVRVVTQGCAGHACKLEGTTLHLSRACVGMTAPPPLRACSLARRRPSVGRVPLLRDVCRAVGSDHHMQCAFVSSEHGHGHGTWGPTSTRRHVTMPTSLCRSRHAHVHVHVHVHVTSVCVMRYQAGPWRVRGARDPRATPSSARCILEGRHTHLVAHGAFACT